MRRSCSRISKELFSACASRLPNNSIPPPGYGRRRQQYRSRFGKNWRNFEKTIPATHSLWTAAAIYMCQWQSLLLSANGRRSMPWWALPANKEPRLLTKKNPTSSCRQPGQQPGLAGERAGGRTNSGLGFESQGAPSWVEGAFQAGSLELAIWSTERGITSKCPDLCSDRARNCRARTRASTRFDGIATLRNRKRVNSPGERTQGPGTKCFRGV